MQILSYPRLLAVAGSLLLGALFFSCAGTPRAAPEPEDDRGISVADQGRVALPEKAGGDDAGTVPAEEPPAIAFPDAEILPLEELALEGLPPEREMPPEVPPSGEFPAEEPFPEDLPIMGEGLAGQVDLSAFLLSNNPGADPAFTEELATLYLEESAIEGINHDIAFAQMCLETGFLRYGGLVKPEMNNFCGLGAISADYPGESFSSPQIGVRAHIQHLKAYASDEGLNQELVDPRFRWVRYGSAPTVDKLTGTWATDREYGVKIRGILGRIYSFAEVE
ncbi:MAG: glucosaminidase domain-containing protein [Treponema sp.]|jgi:hypothetical protein|nr:glucosaminidase domain-containing protein [Treponema sp.]